MNTEDKISLLQEYNDLHVLSNDQFKILVNLSIDDDNTVRSMVAPLLVYFINDTSKNILLKLAQDEDELVRTEALDSLSVFPYKDVLNYLEKTILSEKSSLARSYAILSWVDVVLLLNEVTYDKVKFAQHNKEIEKQTDCALSWCYALYMFGDKVFLNELLKFLKNDDYQIRCTTLALLGDIISPGNKDQINGAVKLLLISENTEAVRGRAERFLKEN